MKEHMKFFPFRSSAHFPTFSKEQTLQHSNTIVGMEDYLQNPKYQANYCEENIWHLGKQYLDLQGSNAYVCLITNSSKTTPIWYQKKCSDLDQPIVWGNTLMK